MIYKVFYQETKERSPRREKTRALYLEVEAANELQSPQIGRRKDSIQYRIYRTLV